MKSSGQTHAASTKSGGGPVRTTPLEEKKTKRERRKKSQRNGVAFLLTWPPRERWSSRPPCWTQKTAPPCSETFNQNRSITEQVPGFQEIKTEWKPGNKTSGSIGSRDFSPFPLGFWRKNPKSKDWKEPQIKQKTRWSRDTIDSASKTGWRLYAEITRHSLSHSSLARRRKRRKRTERTHHHFGPGKSDKKNAKKNEKQRPIGLKLAKRRKNLLEMKSVKQGKSQ